MLEITFTESAGGSLQMAQTFGKGKFHGGCVGIFISHGDGSEPTVAEIEEETRKAEAEERRRWEQAVPLGGNRSDVYCFPLGLAYGDIREPLSAQSRIEVLKVLYSFWNAELEQDLRNQLDETREKLKELRGRIAAGEAARIWYSDIPDELCGFYWLMDELRNLPDGHGAIYALKQPQFDENGDTVCSYNGWGEVEPGHFSKFTYLAVPVSERMIRIYANTWKQLQEENAPIRAGINGWLRSAPEDLYDRYIYTELEKQPDEFKEARLVGNVLGKYQPGISDGYIHHRIDRLVRAGKLAAVTTARDGEPAYWRTLKKVK